MDNPTIGTKRDPVPDWAANMAPPGAPAGMSGAKITDKQRSFLLSLIDERYVKPDQEGKLDLIMKCLRISEDPEEYGMSKDRASELITWFLEQPKKEKPTTVVEGVETTADLSGLPPGRYAIENELGEGPELRFYQCWQSRDKQVKRLYVMFGPSEGHLKYRSAQAIANAIVARGVRECAIRYGMEIGSCSNCGRRLTNHISRALGIGPVCGGRMFGGDDWKEEVKAKRKELKEQGIDPDEEVQE